MYVRACVRLCVHVCVCMCVRACLHVCVCGGIELLDIKLTTIKVKPWSSENREEVFGATLPVTGKNGPHQHQLCDNRAALC